MSLSRTPMTPHRPLYARSLSARRASPGFSYSISGHGSPRTSNDDLTDSPSIPATPADMTNLRVTPKVWSASRLESISEGSVAVIGSEVQKSNIVEGSGGHKSNDGGVQLTRSSGLVSSIVNENNKEDDPFTATVAVDDNLSGAFRQYLQRGRDSKQELQPNSPSLKESIVTYKGKLVTDENAQALLPPGACIFVANLPREMSDANLLDQVKDAFSKYGACWVKIRRNTASNTPHAFVQYSDPENAGKALALGRNERIGARTCRTEMAVAPRILFVYRKDRGNFPRKMVQELLDSIGEICEISEPNLNEQAFYRLPPGYFVKMTIYQAALSAIAFYRQNPIWNVVPHEAVVPTNKEPSRAMSLATQGPESSLVRNRYAIQEPPSPCYECLWIGELPLGVTFFAFIQLVLSQGPINQIETRIFIDPAPTKCAAWVWFSQPGYATRAAQALNGVRLHDCILQARPTIRTADETGPVFVAGGLPSFAPRHI